MRKEWGQASDHAILRSNLLSTSLLYAEIEDGIRLRVSADLDPYLILLIVNVNTLSLSSIALIYDLGIATLV